MEYNVIALPDARPPSCIHQRRALAIDRAHHAVGIGLVVGAVQNLHFIQAHGEDAAVAVILRVERRVGLGRLAEFHMNLRVAIGGLGLEEIIDPRPGGDDAVLDGPFLHMIAGPFGQVLAVEQHIGIAGRRRRTVGTGLHRRRLRPANVIGAPWGVGHLRPRQGQLRQLGIRQPPGPLRMLRDDAFQLAGVHRILRPGGAAQAGRQDHPDCLFHCLRLPGMAEPNTGYHQEILPDRRRQGFRLGSGTEAVVVACYKGGVISAATTGMPFGLVPPAP